MNKEIIIIIVIAIVTLCTRALPFIIFPKDKPIPKNIIYLGKVLPYSIMAMLVVYCLKGVHIFTGSHGIPEIIGISIAIILHIWKENTLLSIFVSTFIYMVCVQYIF